MARSAGARAGVLTPILGLGRAQHQVDQQARVAADPLALAALLLQLERARVGQRPQPVRADQRLVDAAEPAAVGRVDRRPERDRLAVHRPAGRDDEVGERDQALRLDGVVRDDQRGQGEAPDVAPLLLGPRQHDGVDTRARVPTRASTCGNSGFDLRW